MAMPPQIAIFLMAMPPQIAGEAPQTAPKTEEKGVNTERTEAGANTEPTDA